MKADERTTSKKGNIEPETEGHEDDTRREKRREEWGHQADRYLIGCATNKEKVQFEVAARTSNVDGEILIGIPKRVDKDFIQIVLAEDEAREPWINKKYLIGFEKVVSS